MGKTLFSFAVVEYKRTGEAVTAVVSAVVSALVFFYTKRTWKALGLTIPVVSGMLGITIPHFSEYRVEIGFAKPQVEIPLTDSTSVDQESTFLDSLIPVALAQDKPRQRKYVPPSTTWESPNALVRYGAFWGFYDTEIGKLDAWKIEGENAFWIDYKPAQRILYMRTDAIEKLKQMK